MALSALQNVCDPLVARNEFPACVSDAIILMGVGLGVGAVALGWVSVSYALLTA
ncbi:MULTISPECIES: hypothetical protein [unclassified Paracoccus (in: a-proteobacteria)]|uniref:hypothetical protein n=1 Tax=unclassified Paracoccus (in: a-proteobacteria) TaxID=2688777 RepID=UPI001ADCE099|nr:MULTISPECIES: hypothetical protein [unclassified Paracoccus (in: a-proteobacteria)]MBO9456563.1 hypothetical protein [Paracoccus sp. R12_2]